jgi:tetratricopeptide (TPR) repeat protein
VFYRTLVSVYPDHWQGHAELGALLRQQGKLQDAVEPLTRAFEAMPADVAVRESLLQCLKSLGRADDAITLLRARLDQTPMLTPVRNALARTLCAEKEDYAGAIELLREGLELEPDHPQLSHNLGLILANCRDRSYLNPPEAVELLERACKATQNQMPEYLLTLAIAYEADGQLGYAIGTLEKALPIAEATGRTQLAATIRALLAQYQQQESRSTTTAPATQPAD